MIEIITLGDLKINILGEEVAEKHIRTTKLWKLLNLLIIHRDKPLHHSVIMESIWSEENAVLSAKSLHNLIYRLRKMLTYEGAPEFVQFKNNCYMLMSGE
ncbi:MAG: winged helix-turn-helix domain-containing protein, partial [Oscillospiraceae bacterium]|nr:winged helix-turn-helix domain-containing protein [Oscillospiraceae bacterium]